MLNIYSIYSCVLGWGTGCKNDVSHAMRHWLNARGEGRRHFIRPYEDYSPRKDDEIFLRK